MATEMVSSNGQAAGEVEAAMAAASGRAGPAAEVDEAGLGEGAIRWGEGWRSFEEMRGQLEAYEPGEPVAPRINVGRAAAVVRSVAVRDAAPERRAAFEALAGVGRYELSLLDELLKLARCTWYLRRQQQRSAARASEASVPEADVTAAYALRARMMRVVAHWLGDRADMATELAYLREGSGYLDLANDLETLAELYGRDDVRTMIVHDIKHYRPDDVAEAGRLAELIFRAIGLGEEGQAERLAAMTYRAAGLLVRGYEEHRVCGQFLFRKEENVAVTYPSLVTASRRPRRRRRADDERPETPVP
jgi:hypothetical protein